MSFSRWLFLPFLLLAEPAMAYLSVGGAAEIPKEGTYLMGGSAQALINEGGGLMAGGFLEIPHSEDFSSRYYLGVGKIDYHMSAGIKWVPIPDINNQPAMGVKISGWYARTADLNVTTVQIAPLFSKRFKTESGIFTPYASVPVNITNTKDRSYTGTQFTMGSEFHHPDLGEMFFGAELALNLKDSYSFIGATVSVPFDGEKGFSRSK
jgi:hypothetical protein